MTDTGSLSPDTAGALTYRATVGGAGSERGEESFIFPATDQGQGVEEKFSGSNSPLCI